MSEHYIDVVFSGEKFSPGLLREKTLRNIKTIVEYGQISPRGRYKGKPSPYGLGAIYLKKTGEGKEDLTMKAIIRYLGSKISVLKECGVDEVYFDTEHEISEEIMERLEELNKSIR